ncbi:MAG: SLBB domain-containing protein, partial [Bacteroidaceae bacterium]|nr:SLBB domain-containing protein [Bacteroidaceae bacterium]
MIRRLLFVIALSFSFQWVAAQTITDDQVVKMILAEKESGADEETIARKLLQKGATPAQIRRIKEKYEQEQSGLGTVDITGNGGKNNRLRSGKDKNGNFVISKDENAGKEKLPKEKQKKLQKEKEKDMQENMAFLDLDSVLYYKNLLKEETPVFGRNLFNNELLTFEPAMNIPAPADYILGAGDQVIIDVWGASQMTFDNVISPEGFIVAEGVGRIKLAGLTLAEADRYVNTVLGEYYNGSSISLSIGEIRNVKVEIVGEVVAPGSYTLSAFSTLFNALYMAGGINEFGSLREISVYRNGKAVSRIDVYDYIINGNNTGNIRLQDNDLIVVAPYNAIVNIQGKVKRPMKYEMKSDESLAKLLSYTGGLTGDAYDKNIRVIRKNGREYSVHTVVKSDIGTFNLFDGDSIYVDSIIPRFSNMVEIKGAVFHPGMYQVDGKIRTVLDLLEAADGLREDAFLARAVMHRRKADRRLEVLAINLEGILDGTSPDVELRKEDVLFIPSVEEMRGQETLKISGEVNYPGVY